MNVNKLSQGERLIGLFGILLFLDSFLPWFRACIDLLGQSTCVASANGWDQALSLLAVLIAILMVVQVVLANAGTELPRLGTLTWGQVHLIAGVAAFVLVLLQLLLGRDPASRSIGLWLGVLLAAGLAFGGFRRSQEPESVAAAGGGTAPHVPPPPVA